MAGGDWKEDTERKAPFADLSGTVLSGCNFHRAQLQKARLSNTMLDEVDLRESNLEGVNLEQRLMFLGHTDVITSVAVSPDGK